MRASRLPLLTKCAGSAYLPTDDEQSENAARAAEWGKVAHTWKETGEVVAPTSRMATAFRKAVELSGIDRLSLWPPGGKHETGVALQVDGGGRSVRPAAEPAPGYITGTDDFQWYLLDELWIDDLKTGKYYEDPETGANLFPQDVRSAQLRFYALAVSTLLNYTGRVHVSLTHWPRLPLRLRHAEPVRFWTEYHTDELQQFYGELEKLYSEVEAGRSGTYNLRPGDHCRFCPSRAYCLEAQDFPVYQFNSHQPHQRNY